MSTQEVLETMARGMVAAGLYKDIAAAIRAMGETTFQGRSTIITQTGAYCEALPLYGRLMWEGSQCVFPRMIDGGAASQVLVGGDLRLLVDEAVVTASDIAVFGDVTDKRLKRLTKDSPGVLIFNPMYYYSDHQHHYDTRSSTFSCSGEVDLNFEQYKLRYHGGGFGGDEGRPLYVGFGNPAVIFGSCAVSWSS
jgi:hypothetical protein